MPRHDAIGLALAGGVVEGGFYEVGVLCALGEAIEGLDLTALGVYVGVSAGAGIAALLANGVSPLALSRAVLEQADDPTLDLHPDGVFTPAWREYADRLVRLPGIAARTARRLATGGARRSAWGLLTEMSPAIPTALFDGRGIERYFATALGACGRTNDFRAMPTRLRIAAVKLDTAELVAFGAPGLDHVPIARAVAASMALPGVFCPVEIDGELYIDGVARRTMNASLGLKHGARLMLCVNPIVPVRIAGDATERRSLTTYGLPGVLSQTLRTAIHSRMHAAFDGYAHSHPDADLVLIEPEMEDESLFFTNVFSFRNRRAVTEHAYASTRRYLLHDFDRLAPLLARHGLTLRRDRLEADRTLYPADLVDERRPSAMQTAVRSAGSALERLERAVARTGNRRPAA